MGIRTCQNSSNLRPMYFIFMQINQITLIAQYKLIRDENQSSENDWFWRQGPKAKWGGKECPGAVPFLNLTNLLFLLLAQTQGSLEGPSGCSGKTSCLKLILFLLHKILSLFSHCSLCLSPPFSCPPSFPSYSFFPIKINFHCIYVPQFTCVWNLEIWY